MYGGFFFLKEQLEKQEKIQDSMASWKPRKDNFKDGVINCAKWHYYFWNNMRLEPEMTLAMSNPAQRTPNSPVPRSGNQTTQPMSRNTSEPEIMQWLPDPSQYLYLCSYFYCGCSWINWGSQVWLRVLFGCPALPLPLIPVLQGSSEMERPVEWNAWKGWDLGWGLNMADQSSVWAELKINK